jgi:hypothetical protein
MNEEQLEHLKESTLEWLNSEEGHRKIKESLEKAQATKDLWKQGRRLPSQWLNKRINI